jgi:hypothetical protein
VVDGWLYLLLEGAYPGNLEKTTGIALETVKNGKIERGKCELP